MKNETRFSHNNDKRIILCKHARPDIQTEIKFLTTRVKETDGDDWKNY